MNAPRAAIRGRNAPQREGSVRSADGTAIGFVTLGAGPGLVICHGSLSTGDEWLPVARSLADRFTCYVISRRGRGRSESGSAHSLDKECDDVAAVLEAAGPGSHLLGHSYGAICALEAARRSNLVNLAAARGSSLVDRLVLYEPPFPIERPIVASDLETYRSAVAAGRLEEALQAGLRKFARFPEPEIDALRKTPLWGRLAALAPTWLPELEAIAALEPGLDRFRSMARPALLLCGTETAPHHRAAVAALQQTLPAARTLILAGYGHTAHVLAAARVAAAVAVFLNEASSS